MKIIKGIADLNYTIPRAIVTVGNFDGVHLGHCEIINTVVKRAKQENGTSVVYTFRPHPVRALNPQQKLPLINTYDDKLEIISSLGVELVIEEPFSREFSNTNPEQFFGDILLKRLSTKVLYVGYDFAFGKGRAGTLEMLKRFCDDRTVELIVCPPHKVNGIVCSSSRVREYLKNGEIYEANALLGREYFLRGLIVRGDGRGRKLGFPTANISVDASLQLKTGVYATWAISHGKAYRSVTNVGFRPTFVEVDKSSITVETHLLDFAKDIYGEVLEIRFLERLRDEMRFQGVDQLITQIKNDILKASQVFTHIGS